MARSSTKIEQFENQLLFHSIVKKTDSINDQGNLCKLISLGKRYKTSVWIRQYYE